MDNKVPFTLPLRAYNFYHDTYRVFDADEELVAAEITKDQAAYLVQAANLHGEFMAALKPFAALADECDRLGHEENSTCEWRIKASDLRKARAVLGKV